LNQYSRLPKVGTNIFTVMSTLATDTSAINLGQGLPDFPMDPALHRAVAKAMEDGFNQYAPMPGWLPLREAIAEKIHRLYRHTVHPGTDITITPGGTYAIYTALTCILEPGDEVIVFEPSYDSYVPNIEINYAKPVLIALNAEDYSIPWDQVDKAISHRTKAIIINSPHNPTGAVLRESDLLELEKRVAGTGIYVVSDEVYEHLIFDGLQHQSVLRFPGLAARSFACFSFGKVYNCTGWKLGYCVAPPEMTSEFRKVHQFNAFSCITPVQVGLASFLQNEEAYLSLSGLMQSRRDYFIRGMQSSRFSLRPSFGSYFICGSYERISEEADKDFAVRMTREAGVATIPVSAFYQDGTDHKVLRFCFSKKEETLDAALERLCRI
jgi:methionine transaminase